MPRSQCILDGNPIVALGYCNKHYIRFKKYGDPEHTENCPPDATPEERLKFHGWTEMNSGCWEWRGGRDKDGYGILTMHAERAASFKAHRIAYEVWVGLIPEGYVIMHSCDNPPCINPDHLSPGTVGDNTRDMVTKRRGLVGELNPDTKLTSKDVFAIRELLVQGILSQQKIAQKFGITQTTVSQIKLGKTWAHLL